MKIACVDKSAEDRLALQKKLELAFAQCRRSIGHLPAIQFNPTTIDELLINRSCDIVVIGAAMPLEEAHQISKEISNLMPNCPAIVFLNSQYYSLRTLKRFESHATEVFPEDEQAVKIVHKISSLAESTRQQANGKLIVVQGVKGGVGATSIISALAHSAQANDGSAILIDLSYSSALLHYMSATKWQSPDFTTMLVENIIPERDSIEKLITVAPNGIHLLLPPSGTMETRDLLLRNAERFEITLSIVEILRSIYDVVIVDCAQSEGVLPYALFAQAHARVLVTSNDPSSVHLLNSRLSEVMQTPGDGNTHVLLNMLVEKGLTKEDILDFLLINEYFDESMAALESIPFDRRATNWIGTGNSFYTESHNNTQLLLERILRTLLLSDKDLATRQKLSGGIFGSAKRISNLFRSKGQDRLGIELIGHEIKDKKDKAQLRPNPSECNKVKTPTVFTVPQQTPDESNTQRQMFTTATVIQKTEALQNR